MPDQVNDERPRPWAWFDHKIIDEYGPKVGAYGVAVYMALAKFADNQTRTCYPSIPTLARLLAMSRRKVVYTLNDLQHHKLIRIRERPKAGGSHLYCLLPLPGTLAPDAALAPDAVVPLHEVQPPLHEVQPPPAPGATELDLVELDSMNKKSISAPHESPSDAGACQTTSPKKAGALPESQQPGDLHPKVVEAIHAMVSYQFHCLANPLKLNERFWDGQIELIDSTGLLTVYEILKQVDAYYAANPEKLVLTRNEKAARKRMGYGIQFALNQAQKEIRIAKARAQRSTRTLD